MASTLPPDVDLSTIPLEANPSGAPPNFIDPPSQEVTVLAVGLSLTILSAFFVLLRLITNFRVARKLGLDDYLCLFAYILMTAYFALAATFRSTARHAYDIPLSLIDESFVKRAFAINFIVGPCLWASKASILSLYIRLFAPHRWLRMTSYVALVVMFLFYWANTPLAGVFCTASPGQPWDFAVLTKCSKLAIMGPVQGAVGVAADIFILIIPLPVVWKLNLALEKKLGLALVFLAGVFAVVASSVSLRYRVAVYKGDDIFWNSPNIYATVFAECYITIIVSCAPALSSFWKNTVTKSAFYSTLRSRLHSSRSSRSTGATKERASSNPKKSVPLPGSSTSNLVQDGSGYYELKGACYNKPHTQIHSTGKGPFDRKDIITKSTTIDQLSEGE